jgi:hypothetical protein
MAIISDLIKYTRLAWGLRDFLRGTLTLEQSIQIITTRLQEREGNFLRLVQKGIYQNPGSPYLKLLRVAGCEFGDVESLVNQDGIEGTLQKLLEVGVYLSWEEFTGKKEVVRGGSHFQFSEKDFDNPFLPNYYQIQSSGSRSAGGRTAFDLNRMREISCYRLPMLAVNHALDVPLGVWKPMLPGAAGLISVLSQSKVGKPVARWFTPVDERQVESSPRDRLAMRYIIYGSWLWGSGLPKPEHINIEDAAKVARWMADTKKQSGGCSLDSFVSLAVRVCQAAIDNGLDIQGTHFMVGGEPLTPAKRQQIEAAGATVTPRYNITEIGRVGYGCLEAGATDDVHLFHDCTALIQHRRKVEHTDIYVDAFLFTPLWPSAAKILINMESDDYGIVEKRSCNCLYGQLGFDRHIYNIRSFAKLTGSGMSIVGTEFVRILEEVLPAKYGGTATDYQLLEEEDDRGQTHLSLIISPNVGTVDEGAVIATLLTELRGRAYGGKLAAGIWSQANMIQVKRMYPLSRMGKVATLHLVKTRRTVTGPTG